VGKKVNNIGKTIIENKSAAELKLRYKASRRIIYVQTRISKPTI
jgi:hypothetical protein